MRNIFKTGCFGKRGFNGIVRGMGRAGVKNYRKNSKNIVSKSPNPPKILPGSMAIAITGILVSILSFPAIAISPNYAICQFFTGIFIFFLAAYHEFIKTR